MPSTLPDVSASSQIDRAQSESSDGAEPAAAAADGAEELDAAAAGETEEIDAEAVLAEDSAIVPTSASSQALARGNGPPGAMIPAVQAPAVAAGGFVAGAAVVGLVHRRQRRSAALTKGRRAGRALGRNKRSGRAPASAGELVQIVGSRSLLVDVHLLGGRD